jgi:hypothetical protein
VLARDGGRNGPCWRGCHGFGSFKRLKTTV